MQQLKKGFTFIELSFSILFLSLLSLTIVLIIFNIIAIYNKGLAIKTVNSTGSDLIEELFTDLTSAPATELTAICEATFNRAVSSGRAAYTDCVTDKANKFIFNEHTIGVHLSDQPSSTSKSLQVHGAFCSGKYSYIWNTGYVDNPLYKDVYDNKISPVKVKYRVSDGHGSSVERQTDPSKTFRLLRVEDPSRVACASRLAGYGERSDLANNTYALATVVGDYDLTHDASGADYIIASDPVELIQENENSLALYEFYVAQPSQDSTTNRLFYSGSFILATLRGGVDITATGDYCQLKGEGEDFSYCAINKFNFAAQATGK